MVALTSKQKEWSVIGFAGCIAVYGAWLYFQPGRKLPPLRSAFYCEFIASEKVYGLDKDFVVIGTSSDHQKELGALLNPHCLSILAPNLCEKRWESSLCVEICFAAIDDNLKPSVVTTNYFSIDILCSIFIFTYPKISFVNRTLLIETAKPNTKDKNAISVRKIILENIPSEREDPSFIPDTLKILHDALAYPRTRSLETNVVV